MSTRLTESLRPVERFLVRLEDSPWAALYRIAIGFAILPAGALVLGRELSGAELAAAMLAVLLGLRLGPVVLRKILPFSPAALRIWATRRQLGKRFDSLQWQKLFWFGAGLAIEDFARRGRLDTGRFGVTLVFLVSGLGGVVAWRAHGTSYEGIERSHDAGRIA